MQLYFPPQSKSVIPDKTSRTNCMVISRLILSKLKMKLTSFMILLVGLFWMLLTKIKIFEQIPNSKSAHIFKAIFTFWIVIIFFRCRICIIWSSLLLLFMSMSLYSLLLLVMLYINIAIVCYTTVIKKPFWLGQI